MRLDRSKDLWVRARAGVAGRGRAGQGEATQRSQDQGLGLYVVKALLVHLRAEGFDLIDDRLHTARLLDSDFVFVDAHVVKDATRRLDRLPEDETFGLAVEARIAGAAFELPQPVNFIHGVELCEDRCIGLVASSR